MSWCQSGTDISSLASNEGLLACAEKRARMKWIHEIKQDYQGLRLEAWPEFYSALVSGGLRQATASRLEPARHCRHARLFSLWLVAPGTGVRRNHWRTHSQGSVSRLSLTVRRQACVKQRHRFSECNRLSAHATKIATRKAHLP
jgi:hypothetical protein